MAFSRRCYDNGAVGAYSYAWPISPPADKKDRSYSPLNRRAAMSRPSATPKARRHLFSVLEILEWADAHHARTGAWPMSESGLITDVLAEKWRNVDSGLRLGLRGLPGGSSLAQLLAEQRNVRNCGALPVLRRKEILICADAHHKRTGAWPTSESGPIAEAPGETWRAVDGALRVGVRGLAAGSSLAQLLAQRRGRRNIRDLPRFTVRQILAWADAHHKRTGAWPTSSSGPVADAPGETWSAINVALHNGRRGLPGLTTLAQVLAARRGVSISTHLPPLTLPKMRIWARAHKRRTGSWPTPTSGPVLGALGMTWKKVYDSLREGYRGLPGGQTLAILRTERPTDGAPRPRRPPLTDEQILAWADAHHQRTGRWPHSRSGPIPEAPGETWRAVDRALHTGRRGLTQTNSLVRLLTERRDWRTHPYTPQLRCRQVLAWAAAHHRREGSWPNQKSGPIPEAPGETWRSVDDALRLGTRGLPRRVCLARLLAEECGIRNRTNLPRLTRARIWSWAQSHYRRTGRWPTGESGPVIDAPGETWKGINVALRHGYRGFAAGQSLARLLAARRAAKPRD
jgi:hypothetical protein